jgi:hypothetical protein
MSLVKVFILEWEEWWLLGRSGGSLVATPDCKPTVLGSNPADSPAYSGLPVLSWAAIWDGSFTVGCPLSAAKENINKKRMSSPSKTIKEKKVFIFFHSKVAEGHTNFWSMKFPPTLVIFPPIISYTQPV